MRLNLRVQWVIQNVIWLKTTHEMLLPELAAELHHVLVAVHSKHVRIAVLPPDDEWDFVARSNLYGERGNTRMVVPREITNLLEHVSGHRSRGIHAGRDADQIAIELLHHIREVANPALRIEAVIVGDKERVIAEHFLDDVHLVVTVFAAAPRNNAIVRTSVCTRFGTVLRQNFLQPLFAFLPVDRHLALCNTAAAAD